MKYQNIIGIFVFSETIVVTEESSAASFRLILEKMCTQVKRSYILSKRLWKSPSRLKLSLRLEPWEIIHW